MSRYQKGKTNLDFTEARDSECQWHQLGHMQVCTSFQTDNHASTPPLSFLQAGCPSCRPTNSVKALKVDKFDTVPQKWVLGRGPMYRQHGAHLFLFQKFIFLFSYVELFGYDNSRNEGTVKVLAKFGNFPISPKMGGRGEESNNGITPNRQLFTAYSRAVHSLVLRSGANKEKR